jgi:hypothetical protein
MPALDGDVGRVWWTIQKGSNRANPGGGWDNDSANCGTANRNTNDPTNRNTNNGFRPALNSAREARNGPEVPDGTGRLPDRSDADLIRPAKNDPEAARCW